MPNIRGLDLLLTEFDRRQRPDARSRNRVLSKYAAVADVVGLSSDSQIVALSTPPFHWHDPVGSTALSLIWGLGEWRA